ncbi:MAG: ABC transporter ATP-binding protein [Deltaproteobacteria bacterium]|nr:ABC transporter ATP-binding protein [Deltaproteobacteria bacterium]
MNFDARKCTTNLLTVEDLHLSFGGLRVLNGVSFEVEEGTICALIGPNGSGKTSVLNCINHFYPGKGTMTFKGHNISNVTSQQVAKLGIARTFQNIALFKGMSVLENIKVGRHMAMKSGLLSGGIYFGRARREEIRQRQFIEDEVIDILHLEGIRETIVGSLPYGKQKLVELARALALNPQLLILDEPSAGMNQEETEDMVRYILDVKLIWSLSVLLVEHNMDVVADIADACCVLNHGVVIAFGTPDTVRQNEAVIEAYIGN